MAATTPKSTPKKASATASPAASPAATPSRVTRAQAKAATPKTKTPSPSKKQSPSTITPTSSTKETLASPSTGRSSKKAASSLSKTSPKVIISTPSSSKKTSPASPAASSPSKATGSHANLARKPTSALATAQPITAEYSSDEEPADDDDDEDDQDSDLEEGQDVSNKGMQRLLAALGEDGLDEADMAALEDLAGDEEDEEDDEEESLNDQGAEELEDDEASEGLEDLGDEGMESENDEDELPKVKASTNGDTLAASIARSGLVPEMDSEEDEDDEDPEADDDEEIAYEDLPDDVEIPEAAKASRVQRIKVNNETALRRIYEDIRLDSPTASTKLPWIETMRITYPTSISSEVTDAENDLERELAFYKQALHAAVEGKKLVETSGTPFTRPSDYFAEMVKTDDHMERIRQKLLDETAAIKASEAAKKQRELKKFGKKVQVEKLEERLRKKKEMNEKITGLKRKRGNMDNNDDDAGEDQFDVRLEQALADKSDKPFVKGGKRDGPHSQKARMPRSARDSKYGFGGKKKYAKSNTAESTNDFSIGPTRGARGSKPRPPPSGKTGFRPKQKSGAAKRPGKARRAGTR